MIDTANDPKMWVAVPVIDGDYETAKDRVSELCVKGRDDYPVSPTAHIGLTGWYRVVTRTDRLPYLFVELFDCDSKGDIPSAVKFFMQNNLDADWPESLDPETGHIRGFSTSFN